MAASAARDFFATLVEAPVATVGAAEFLVRSRRVAEAARRLAAAPFAAVVAFPSDGGLLLAVATPDHSFLMDASRIEVSLLQPWLAFDRSIKVVRRAPLLAERLRGVGLNLAGAFDLSVGQAVLRRARAASGEPVGGGTDLPAAAEQMVRLVDALGLARSYVQTFLGQRVALGFLEQALGTQLVEEVRRETAAAIAAAGR